MRTTAILGFHKIGPAPPGGWESWFYIPEMIFREQLKYLDANGWEILDAARFLRGLEDPVSLPQKSALLTFDDGYRSIAGAAVQCLREFGDPAVLFVPTEFIGGRNTFDQDNEPEEEICTWSELEELARCGISIQSHGVSHRAFSNLDGSSRYREVAESKAELESHLGRAVELFSFPYGDAGRDAQSDAALEQAGYRAAFLYGGGVSAMPAAHRFRLPRIAMGPDTDLARELEEFR